MAYVSQTPPHKGICQSEWRGVETKFSQSMTNENFAGKIFALDYLNSRILSLFIIL